MASWERMMIFAGVVVFLSSKASAHVNGVVIPVDGGGNLVGDLFRPDEEEGEVKAKL